MFVRIKLVFKFAKIGESGDVFTSFFYEVYLSNLLNLGCLYSSRKIFCFFMLNLTLVFGNTLCFMLVKMFIKVSYF